MSAIAAVDMALWDIKAKVAGLPLYQLLGGASRTGVMVYGHANGATIEETINEALKYQAMGYKAIRLQTGVPGLPSTYGVSKDKLFYEPADAAIPTENVWSTSKYLPTVPKLFEAAREALGWEVHLLHDSPSPPDPHRGRPPGQGPGALPPVLDGGRHARREPGQLPPDPPAHHHAPGRGRGVQLDLGLQAADRRAADRLYPHHHGPRRRHLAT
jgi:hypothetical protein